LRRFSDLQDYQELLSPLCVRLSKASIFEFGIAGLSFTQGQDFEEDIYESFNVTDYVKYLEKEFPGERKADCFIGKAKGMGVSLDHQNLIHTQLELLSLDEIQKLKALSKESMLKSMRNSKSILDGEDLGNYVTEIPEVYKNLI
jgi:hypothetical protein